MKYFAYCRKSQDAEERQVLSIPAQRDEIERVLQKFPDIELVELLEESKTAKTPGRPVFNQMMKRIEMGEAEGLIAWHPDRLARNSIDGGLLIYFLDQGRLKDLKFSTYSFENSSQGKFMLQIMFGYSKYYVDSLSENVKRGMRRKLEQGVRPNRAPLGYRNDPDTRAIVIDPPVFEVLRRLWELALENRHSGPELWRKLDREWGFRMPKRKHSGGARLSLAALYKLLNNRFYAGFIAWNGKVYQGAHMPMVTPAEFEQVQIILGRKGRRAPVKHQFAYTGLIRCGTCGCSVTAETKVKPSGRRYTYYHCTKKRHDADCNGGYLSEMELERQIAAFIRDHTISKKVFEWAVEQIQLRAADENSKVTVDRLKDALKDTERSLATLTDLRIRNILGDDDFLARRTSLQTQVSRLTLQIVSESENTKNWLEPCYELLSFSQYAISWFERGTIEQKRRIAKAIGSNFRLTGKKLSIDAVEPLRCLPKTEEFLLMCGLVENVRTRGHENAFHESLEQIRAVVQEMQEVEGRNLNAAA